MNSYDVAAQHADLPDLPETLTTCRYGGGMAVSLEWREPRRTRIGHPSAHWQQVADTLREHPGEWAVVAPTASRSLAGNIASANIRAFQPAGSFEATCERVEGEPPEIYCVLARFVGGA